MGFNMNIWETLLKGVLNGATQGTNQYSNSSVRMRPVRAVHSENSYLEGTMSQVFDILGRPKNLGDLIAKPGGEGSVYILKDKPGILV
jgi:hypothetical protein